MFEEKRHYIKGNTYQQRELLSTCGWCYYDVEKRMWYCTDMVLAEKVSYLVRSKNKSENRDKKKVELKKKKKKTPKKTKSKQTKFKHCDKFHNIRKSIS